MSETERIVAAAICVDGEVHHMLPPNRHYNVMHRFYRETGRVVGPDEQGFITNTGEFVTRVQAKVIADMAGQTKPRGPREYSGPELFSEDLW
jgi:hypothetical protein